MIVFDVVSKEYGKVRAVDAVSFTCGEKSVTVLLGPNGAGKTTLLKAAAGLHYPSSGCVRIDGLSVEEYPAVCGAGVALVTELPVLPGHFTTGSYLKTIARLYHPDESSAQRLQRFESVVSQCALFDMLKVKIKALSKGYQQRVAFAQALLKDTGNLILDEPVSGLDPAQIIEMRDLIRRVAVEKTVLLSTHLMQEAEQLADRIVILYQGRVVAAGSKDELLSQTGTSSLEEAYIACTGGRR